MDVSNFSKENLFSFIKENKSYQRVVVIFTAEWCGACKRVLSVFQQLLEERKEKDVLLLQVDIKKNPTLSSDPFFAVSITPKMFVFREGIFWKQLEGSIDFDSLKKFLQL